MRRGVDPSSMCSGTRGIAAATFVASALAACGRFGFVERQDGPDAARDGANDATHDAAPLANYIFQTSTLYDFCANPNVLDSDSACQSHALSAGLPGTYVAFVSSPSDASLSARARLGSARGWIRPDGKPFADSVASLLDGGEVFFPPRLDATGADLGYVYTVTASTSAGIYDTNTGCMLGGLPTQGGFTWSSGIVVSTGRLTCLGIDHDSPITITPATGRIAFVSTTTFDPSTGITGADALCADEATAAQLAGEFAAFLPKTTVAAASRFDLAGDIWVRVDGIPIVEQTSDIATWNLLAPLERRADGSLATTRVWTGSDANAPTLASTCNDWTSNAPGQGGTTLAAESHPSMFGKFITASCGTRLAVFCLQR